MSVVCDELLPGAVVGEEGRLHPDGLQQRLVVVQQPLRTGPNLHSPVESYQNSVYVYPPAGGRRPCQAGARCRTRARGSGRPT